MPPRLFDISGGAKNGTFSDNPALSRANFRFGRKFQIKSFCGLKGAEVLDFVSSGFHESLIDRIQRNLPREEASPIRVMPPKYNPIVKTNLPILPPSLSMMGFTLMRALMMMLCLVTGIQAAPPDLTAGGVPGDTLTINLGPTGARGWVYHVREKTDESRQIQVKLVDAGSPAAGILAADDVILGANGTGANPVNFTSDARKSLATAIADAEARNPADLKLIRWRAGNRSPPNN